MMPCEAAEFTHEQVRARVVGSIEEDMPALLERIRGEYREMPGLKLTPAQAQRLWGVSPERCAATLGRLVEERFLRVTPDGSFMRNRS